MVFYSMGNIPFQTILEQWLEHNVEKMEVHDEHKYLYASCFFCEHMLC